MLGNTCGSLHLGEEEIHKYFKFEQKGWRKSKFCKNSGQQPQLSHRDLLFSHTLRYLKYKVARREIRLLQKLITPAAFCKHKTVRFWKILLAGTERENY